MHFDLEHTHRMIGIGQKLRDLPTERALPIHWGEFKRREILRRARTQRRRIALAAVVGVVMVVGAVALWKHLPPTQATLAQRMAVASLAPAERPAPVAWEEAGARSVASERWLAAQPAEPVIVRVSTRATVMNLEDRIAWVDDTLTSMRAEEGEAEHARALQYERDRLINSLAQVRYAETLAANLP